MAPTTFAASVDVGEARNAAGAAAAMRNAALPSHSA
jgi:hypothetical protein